MNAKNDLLVLIVLLFTFGSCTKSQEYKLEHVEKYTVNEDVSYTFFAAGHAYGNPMAYQYGIHAPFKTMIPQINAYPKLNFGVLTGDVVPKPTQEYWDSALLDLDNLNVPWHIAPGNHDKGPIFDQHFKDYYSFTVANDLMFVLSPKSWNIEGEQLDMVKTKIDSCKSTVDNIFIFCHELIWWTPENEFGDIEINYRPHYPGKTNYWDLFQPYLDSLEVPVYLIAGDIGASEQVDPYMYRKQNNITYVASGVGSRINDNILFFEISKTGEVAIKLIGVKNKKFGIIATY